MSVSLFALPPQCGHVVLTNSSDFARGLFPSGLNSTLYGNLTGKSFSGTGTTPHLSQ